MAANFLEIWFPWATCACISLCSAFTELIKLGSFRALSTGLHFMFYISITPDTPHLLQPLSLPLSLSLHPWPLVIAIFLDLFPQSLLILLSYLLSQDLKGFVESSLFNISLKCSTHLFSLSRVPVLRTPFLALTPTSRLCHSPVIDLVMLNSSLNSSYLSHQPFPLLQPSSLTNFSNLPWHSFSLPCFSHYTSLFISVSVVPILRPPFSILPLSSPWSFPMFCTIFSY